MRRSKLRKTSALNTFYTIALKFVMHQNVDVDAISLTNKTIIFEKVKEILLKILINIALKVTLLTNRRAWHFAMH